MIRVLSILFLLSACGGSSAAPDEPSVPVIKATYDVMSARNLIVARPALVRLGLKPLELDQARSYMNKLFDALRPDLEKTNITYQMAGHDIILTIQAHLILDSKTNIIPSIAPRLDSMARIMKEYDRTFVAFNGFTSNKNSRTENLAQSLIEAEVVAEFFMRRSLHPSRVFISGQGESAPVADNANREGQLLNHRIEIRISPLI